MKGSGLGFIFVGKNRFWNYVLEICFKFGFFETIFFKLGILISLCILVLICF